MPVEVSCAELQRRLQAGEPTYLLDCRQPEEHALARIERATLVPMGDIPQRLQHLDPPEGAAIIVFCHHGVRSRMVAQFLEQNGFSAVGSLTGGIDAWSRLIDPSIPRY